MNANQFQFKVSMPEHVQYFHQAGKLEQVLARRELFGLAAEVVAQEHAQTLQRGFELLGERRFFFGELCDKRLLFIKCGHLLIERGAELGNELLERGWIFGQLGGNRCGHAGF